MKTKLATCAVLLMLLIEASAVAQQSRFRNRKQGKTAATKSSAPKTYSKDFNVVREGDKNVLYKKKYTVDFDAALIRGEVKNPSDFYFVHRPEEKFGSLLQKRKNFHKEMLRDTVMIR